MFDAFEHFENVIGFIAAPESLVLGRRSWILYLGAILRWQGGGSRTGFGTPVAVEESVMVFAEGDVHTPMLRVSRSPSAPEPLFDSLFALGSRLLNNYACVEISPIPFPDRSCEHHHERS